MKRIFSMTAITTGILLGTMGGTAYADDDERAKARAKVSIQKAISIAESQVKGGRAIDSDFEADDGRIYYEIDVVGRDKRKYEIKVDANSGRVISKELDDDELRGGGDDDDDDDDDDRRRGKKYDRDDDDDDDDDRRRGKKYDRDDDDDDDDDD